MLVDKRISDITPDDFLKRHSRFSIAMVYGQDEAETEEAGGRKKDDAHQFSICLDALDDDHLVS